MLRRVQLLVAPLPVGVVVPSLAGGKSGNGFVNLVTGARSFG